MPSHRTTSDPWISRYYHSKLLSQSNGPSGSDVINTEDQEVYGDSEYKILFRIGNGGAGYTGILRMLAEMYIAQNGGGFRIGWVSNHSRHSQIALLADVVHVALTYEPENEDLAVEEGWARRVGRAFNDHFILVGPDVDLGARDIGGALRVVAESNVTSPDANGSLGQNPITFHTRGDGSATFAKEQVLWHAAGVDASAKGWIKTCPLTPYDALVQAEKEGAFLLTDRATFLTAKQDGVIPSLRAHVEGDEALLNPCSVLVKSDSFVRKAGLANSEELDEADTSADDAAARFASWLISDEAQDTIKDYGLQWRLRKPLFTVAHENQFGDEHLLSSM
ncbi:hypothetical protein PRZ48_003263 [Zasmidium cellare]|uniref:PBP domain-containing protein n=1 Tax=Zasmidium cellare TaxID=395010 RepID=A0ABR0EVL5_ZASCE|nr:hypothetical protein PRZ48_003263 [Zasmidium cellare]